MAYAAWSVVFGEQPSAAKWNILGTNDASFNDGTGIADATITPSKRTGGFKAGTISLVGNGSLATTGVGFTPKLLEFQLASDNTSSLAKFARGATDGTNSWSHGINVAEGGDASGSSSTTYCFFYPGSNGAQSNTATFSSFGADGFTLTIGGYTSGTTWGYVAYG